LLNTTTTNMGCCHSAKHIKGDVKRAKAQSVSQLKEGDSANNVIATIMTQQKQDRDSFENTNAASVRPSEYMPTRALRIHLKSAASLPNLDFNTIYSSTIGAATNMVGVTAIDDVSDPYVLFAVGEAGVDWTSRQHQGPIVKSKTINDDLNPTWDEVLELRVAEDLDNPELHVMLYDSDTTIGNVINFEDDFLGEVRIPLSDDANAFNNIKQFQTYPLMGELAKRNNSTVVLSWEYVNAALSTRRPSILNSPVKSGSTNTSSRETAQTSSGTHLVEYRVTALTGDDSYVAAGTKQPVYAMFVGDLGTTPLLCLQDKSEQVLVSSTAAHWIFEWENIGRPLYICIQLGNSTKEHCWGLSAFQVSRYGKTWSFPFYSWLYSGKPSAIVFEGTAYTPEEMKNQEKYFSLEQHKLHDHSVRTKRLSLSDPNLMPHHTSGTKRTRTKSVASMKFKQDGIHYTNIGEKDDGHSTNEKIRASRQHAIQELLSNRGAINATQTDEERYQVILKLMDEKTRDQTNRINRLFKIYQQTTDAGNRSGGSTTTPSIESLCDHDPHEDPTNDLSDLAKQHFDAVTDYYAASSSSSSASTTASTYNDRTYEMYQHDGTVVSSSFHQHDDFLVHHRDAHELIPNNPINPLENDGQLHTDQQFISLSLARSVEIKTHQQEYPWAKNMYMKDKTANWRMLPGQIKAAG